LEPQLGLNLCPTTLGGTLASVLDEKRRVVLPKDLADEMGLAPGSPVSFKKGKGVVIIQKAKGGDDQLKAAMEWNPVRKKTPAKVTEKEVKEVWR
jgi:AbrB family looped-hinge helix DNA binding protein